MMKDEDDKPSLMVTLQEHPNLLRYDEKRALHTVTAEISEWLGTSMKNPVLCQRGGNYYVLIFETMEDAALFKLFWL
jgi:hypothetical protein